MGQPVYSPGYFFLNNAADTFKIIKHFTLSKFESR